MEKTYSYKTCLGTFWISSKGKAISRLVLPGDSLPEGIPLEETEAIKEAGKQLMEYIDGKRRDFEINLAPEGTDFQRKVWKTLEKIPYGETRTYGEIAVQVDRPKAARAVGMANNRNPIAVFIPCHRVIGASGKLVGYGGGLPLKEKLLKLEKGQEIS